MRARVLATSAVLAVAALTLPAHAAAPTSTTLFFDNAGSCGADDPVYALVTGGAAGNECSSIQVAAAGSGFLVTDDYASSGKKAIGYKVDSGRKLTGTVYIANYPLVSVSGGPVQTIPGLTGAEVTISINGVSVGTASGSGQVIMPNGAYAIPVNLTIPKSLSGKVVKTVIASVSYTDASGITGVSYSDPAASKIVIPTKR